MPVPRRRLAAGKAPPGRDRGRIAQLTPGASDMRGTYEAYILVKRAIAPVRVHDHGARRLLGAKIADAKQTAGLTPLAQEASPPAGRPAG